MSPNRELEAVYRPADYERRWWRHWIDNRLFASKVDPSRKPFTIVIPPPNVTDRLHMGHGLNNTIQDILTRWRRMQGYNACWVPGTDHAGIATQMMVEKALVAEGTSRAALGREKFLERLWQWKEKHGGVIIEQLKRLGCSCDWDREAFTMSPALSAAVRHIFVRLFEEGLVYRDQRLVNWDPALKTAISDDEVETEELQGTLWQFRYPVAGATDGASIAIATTRPETMFGDTAVAVHPDDERYSHLIGKSLRLPLADRLIPVVADDQVKMDFGTGAVKVTPAHDANDFAIGRRHSLPSINIMNDDATMADNVPPPFRGLDRFKARKEVVRAMKEQGFYEGEKAHRHAVPHSSRSKAVIEPRLSLQWFVKMGGLARSAAEAVRSEKIHFHPKSQEKTYFHWLENIQDWCISRQLWWGHRIPIWYCADCQGITCATVTADPTQCSKCASKKIKQDEDVLDTWFSSWLWPLSCFGWPEETPDLNYYYPTNVLSTGPDIIFLWVARMIMVGLQTREEIPFTDVYFHSIICDKQGRKFSKTLGNGIDPLAVIEKHGADAVRFTCVSTAPLGGRVKMAVEEFDNGARFINKLWNACRFLMQNLEGTDQGVADFVEAELDLPSRWLIHELRTKAGEVSRHLESFRLNEAVNCIYHLIWRALCDWGIECAKGDLRSTDPKIKARAQSVMVYVLDGILRVAHPVMPFVTEEIWQRLPKHPRWDRPISIVTAVFPEPAQIPDFTGAAETWERVQDLVSGVRSVRTQAEIPPKESLQLCVVADDAFYRVVEASREWILRLANAKGVERWEKVTPPSRSLVFVGRNFSVYVPVGDFIDTAREITRLQAEAERLEKVVAGIKAKLDNPSFMERAPEDIRVETVTKHTAMRDQLEAVQQNLVSLRG